MKHHFKNMKIEFICSICKRVVPEDNITKPEGEDYYLCSDCLESLLVGEKQLEDK